jgi:hypothetical protein
MCEAAMVGETEGRAFEAAEDIQIRRFRSESECERGKRGLAVESGAAHACAGEEVGNRFQGPWILFGLRAIANSTAICCRHKLHHEEHEGPRRNAVALLFVYLSVLRGG